MADDAQTIRAIHWREVFPFTHIFRAFRIAVHPSKLVLGLLALLTLYTGGRILDGLWPTNSLAVPGEIVGHQRYRESLAMGGDAAPPTSFPEMRDAMMRSNREEYAFLLLNRKAAPDRAKAEQMSADWSGKSELEARISEERATALKAAEDSRKAAIEEAEKIKDDNAVTQASRRQQAKLRAEDAYREAFRKANSDSMSALRTIRRLVPRGIFIEFFEYEVNQINSVWQGVRANNWTGGMDLPSLRGADTGAAGPLAMLGAGSTGVIPAIINFFTIGPVWLIRYHFIYFVLFACLFLLVWAVFGGAIARIAAVHVARDEKMSVRQALRFSTNKLLSFVFAPVIPMLIVAFIGAVIATGGLLFYIPWIGPIVAACLFFLALIAGVVIALVLLGTAGGFNLMYPTVAVEGSDSFDAISRSFSYVFARPWRMLFYTLVAVAYGALTYLFVRFFIYLVLTVTHYFVGWWLFKSPGRWWPEIWPTPTWTSLPYEVNFHGLKWSEAASAGIISFWVYLVIGLLGAFGISFYFSANTIIYYLMRREVDATELDDVYIEESEDELTEPAPVTARSSDSSMPQSPAVSAGMGGTGLMDAGGEPGTSVSAGNLPPTGATSAPGGGISGTAGSSSPGGSGGPDSYTPAPIDTPAPPMPPGDAASGGGAT
jgi:hypothetical protein